MKKFGGGTNHQGSMALFGILIFSLIGIHLFASAEPPAITPEQRYQRLYDWSMQTTWEAYR